MIYEGLLYNRVEQYLDNNIVINIDTYSINFTPTPSSLYGFHALLTTEPLCEP